MAEKETSERYEQALRQLEAFAKAPRPIVFQFQPERFEVVTGDRLQEWDRLMRTRVGMQVEAGGISCLPCISFCGPSFEDACDCDCV